jgi:hypothetical protein
VQVDEQVLVFFESVPWTDEFGRDAFQAGFSGPPGGAHFANRSIYAYHFYKGINLGDLPTYLRKRVSDARRWGCASMVGWTSSCGGAGNVISSLSSVAVLRNHPGDVGQVTEFAIQPSSAGDMTPVHHA